MDRILWRFREQQAEGAVQLCRETNLVSLAPIGPSGAPPERWFAVFHGIGLVRRGDGEIVRASDFAVGIWIADDYLRRADTFRNLSFLGPKGTWHPNVSERHPVLCIGHIAPSTPLVELVERLHQVLTYQRVTMSEADSLNKACCAWAREHQGEFPIDPRPLRAPAGDFQLEDIPENP